MMDMGIDMARGYDETIETVWSVDRAGIVDTLAVLAVKRVAENARMKAVKLSGKVPPACGPEIPNAPARGPVKLVQPVVGRPDGKGGVDRVKSGYRGRAARRRVDAFDLMERAARRKKVPMWLTATQIETGRDYAALYERYHGGDIKGSSFGDRVGGSGDGGRDVMDLRLADRERMRQMQGWIGDGVALAVRRVRPSNRAGGQRVPIIKDRDVVYAVCIKEQTLSQLLRDMGWSRDAANVKALQRSLSEALDRMAGPVERSGLQTHRTGGERPLW